jgi:hypothetical protein
MHARTRAAALLLVLLLSGCAARHPAPPAQPTPEPVDLGEAEPPAPYAFHAKYASPAGTIALDLAPGTPVADEYGTPRPAHLLRINWTASAALTGGVALDEDFDNESVAFHAARLDGGFRVARYESYCTDDLGSPDPCDIVVVDWETHGAPAPFGVGLPRALVDGVLSYQVNGVTKRTDTPPAVVDDRTRVVADVLHTNWQVSGRIPGGVFYYDPNDLFVPVAFDSPPVIGWFNEKQAFERTEFVPGAALPPLEPWPPAPTTDKHGEPMLLYEGAGSQVVPNPEFPPGEDAVLFMGLEYQRAQEEFAARQCVFRFTQGLAGQPYFFSDAHAVQTQIGLTNSDDEYDSFEITSYLVAKADGTEAPSAFGWYGASSAPNHWYNVPCKEELWPAPPVVSVAEFASYLQQADLRGEEVPNDWRLLRQFEGQGEGEWTFYRSLELYQINYRPSWVQERQDNALPGESIGWVDIGMWVDATTGAWARMGLEPTDVQRLDAGEFQPTWKPDS